GKHSEDDETAVSVARTPAPMKAERPWRRPACAKHMLNGIHPMIHPRTAVCFLSILFSAASTDAGDRRSTPDDVLAGLRTFFAKTARPDGSFQPGIDPAYK